MKRDAEKRVRLSRVVLVGLPGAGKSTVGALVAARLGFDFLDVDREIERAAGLGIPAIFRERGEAAFRRLEAEAVRELLRRDHLVLAPGAGWAAQPDAVAELPEATTLVWLMVSAAEAARRLEQDPAERPLLSGADMVTRLSELEGERMLAYSVAGTSIETNGRDPEAIADEIARRLEADYLIDGEAD